MPAQPVRFRRFQRQAKRKAQPPSASGTGFRPAPPGRGAVDHRMQHRLQQARSPLDPGAAQHSVLEPSVFQHRRGRAEQRLRRGRRGDRPGFGQIRPIRRGGEPQHGGSGTRGSRARGCRAAPRRGPGRAGQDAHLDAAASPQRRRDRAPQHAQRRPSGPAPTTRNGKPVPRCRPCGCAATRPCGPASGCRPPPDVALARGTGRGVALIDPPAPLLLVSPLPPARNGSPITPRRCWAASPRITTARSPARIGWRRRRPAFRWWTRRWRIGCRHRVDGCCISSATTRTMASCAGAAAGPASPPCMTRACCTCMNRPGRAGGHPRRHAARRRGWRRPMPAIARPRLSTRANHLLFDLAAEVLARSRAVVVHSGFALRRLRLTHGAAATAHVAVIPHLLPRGHRRRAPRRGPGWASPKVTSWW